MSGYRAPALPAPPIRDKHDVLVIDRRGIEAARAIDGRDVFVSNVEKGGHKDIVVRPPCSYMWLRNCLICSNDKKKLMSDRLRQMRKTSVVSLKLLSQVLKDQEP